jgi:NitT/TauT family transport system substrate-binding protein/putative hydroxymethylpyrimidine transport system substrate-binding protein
MRLSPLPLIAILLALAGCGQPSSGIRSVPLALDFTPNAAHAAIYAAAADPHAPVRLEPRAPGGSTDSLKLLTSGRADFAVLDIHDLGLAREAGEDVVGVGSIVQRPLAAVIAQEDIERPQDLEGKRVGVTGLPSDDAVLRAVVESDGGRFDLVDPITLGFSAVPSLVSGKVDAVVTFWNAEGVALNRRGVPTTEFRVDRHGAPPYPELVLATRGELLRDDPELVDQVLAALRDGASTLADESSAALDAVTEASGAEPELTRAQYDALADAFVGTPALDREALEQWAEFDARFGILESAPDVEAAFPR